ncbi:hypothetical protein HK101_003189 [Irineochytrium annulatum]|nr:hypothetical protein HK101_003189 [Irineochytrium annulatum]
MDQQKTDDVMMDASLEQDAAAPAAEGAIADGNTMMGGGSADPMADPLEGKQYLSKHPLFRHQKLTGIKSPSDVPSPATVKVEAKRSRLLHNLKPKNLHEMMNRTDEKVDK